jgi:DNA polymerase-3 subunit epsilon
MRLLGLDFETTGLDPVEDYVTEVGVVLWDTERRGPISIDSYFVKHDGIELTEEITKITGIQQADLNEFGLDSETAFYRLSEQVHIADAVVAHNGELFDRKFYREWCKKVTATDLGDQRDDKPWIDTQNDIDYPEEIRSRKLTYLAAEHGFLNPFAHRAVFDVLTMLKVLENYKIDEILYSAQQPTIVLQALVSYDDREKAKEKRFRWDATTKMWVRSIKKHKIEKENFPFKTRVIG